MNIEDYDFEKEILSEPRETEHKISKRLRRFKDFYSCIRHIASGYKEISLNGEYFNMNSIFYTSIIGTLESIEKILLDSKFNDAISLIRKYCDDIVMETYLSIIQKETYDKLNSIVSWKDIANNRVFDWIKSKRPLLDEHPKKEIQKIIETFPKIFEILNLNTKDNLCLYNKINSLLYDNLHFTSFHNFLWNDASYIKKNNKTELGLLDNIFICITFLSSLHFAFIYEIHPEYFNDFDYFNDRDKYIDSIDPPSVWRRKIEFPIQIFFSEVVYPFNQQLGDYLISLDLMDLDYGR